MEQTRIKVFNCPIHKDMPINLICSDLDCTSSTCCIDCILDNNSPHLSHKKLLLSLENYVDHIVQKYKSHIRIKLGQNGLPEELKQSILKGDETLKSLYKHIEEEKKGIEKFIAKLMDDFLQIFTNAKTTAFQKLDEQFNNLKTDHEIYKSKLKQYYDKDINPTISEIINKINRSQNSVEFVKIIQDFRLDLSNKVPNDENLLKAKIEEIKIHLNLSGELLKRQYEMRPKSKLIIEIDKYDGCLKELSKSFTSILANSSKLIKSILKEEDFFKLDSKILVMKEAELLRRWINSKSPIMFKLLYRATHDGFSPHNFYRKVGSKKKTIIIIHSNHGKRFGGYSDKNWDNRNILSDFKKSNNTFLFSFDEKEIYPVKFPGYAICCKRDYPSFGNGDLPICKIENESNESYAFFGRSYDSKGKSNINLIGHKTFSRIEIEAFQVKPFS